MRPWAKRLVRNGAIIAAVLFILLATASWVVLQLAIHEARRDFPPPGRLIDVGGRLHHIHCIGTGSPTILLESGLDDRGSWSWSSVQEDLGRISRVCSYDRAGMLWSEPGEEPRTGRRIAAELHTLLAAASESPPYVMVGHSLGALYTRVYHDEYPGEVEGFVMVDPAHPEQEARFPAEVRERMRDSDENKPPRWLLRVAAPYRMFAPERATPRTAYWWRTFPEGVIGEIEAIQTTFSRAALTGPIGNRPLIVLSAGVEPELPGLSASVNEAFRQTIRDGRAEMITLSTNSSHRVVEGAGHYIHSDRPDAVIEAIRDVVTAIREQRTVD
jgi:pimeloyl-ACP methyl ester carboxylesterase